MDFAERASLFGRGEPMLRLHPEVLKQLDLSVATGDPQEARDSLRIVADETEMRGWRNLWVKALIRSRQAIVVEGEEPWNVLRGKRITPLDLRAALNADDDTIEDGVELTTDDDDSFYAGRSVTLSRHSADVEHFARVYALAAGLSRSLMEDLALAGWLHDIGKSDRRFQILLRGGSEIDFFKDETPWAKSAMPQGAKAAHRLAQKMSGYPRGARHEVQSVAMLETHFEVVKAKAHDVDLVLHLVASHHGYCRPFAPAICDSDPVEVTLPNHESTAFGVMNFSPTSSNHNLHRLDAPLAGRFWGLVRKYGWLELCWLEAILRLADHRASESEQSSGEVE
jgi:CRISPR-associated endonuclease/helicase Cas3